MSVAVRVIPCLDVKEGRVVKGVNFQGLRDAGDPVELARRYDAEGADEITFLDVSASSEGRATMLDVVSATFGVFKVLVGEGGGICRCASCFVRLGGTFGSCSCSCVGEPDISC